MNALKRFANGLGVLALIGSAACSASPGDTGSTEGEGVTEAELSAATEAPQSDEDGVEPADSIDGEDAKNLFPTGSDQASGDTSAQALSTCRNTTGYRGGRAFTICVTPLEGHLVEIHTANSYLAMQSAARRDGVHIGIVSGFRSMSQQRYLYGLYQSGRGNLAAVPGFSNHQSGHALDLNTSAPGVYTWLERHGAAFGFGRTVPSEIWHWEVWSAGSGYAGGGSKVGCHSDTLGREVAANACVQSHIDRKWYQCNGGRWVNRWSDPMACSSVHAL